VIPKLLESLWKSSALGRVSSLRVAWGNALLSSKRFRRRLTVSDECRAATSQLRSITPSPSALLSIPADSFSSYVRSVHCDLQSVCAVKAHMVSLPDIGHCPRPLVDVLPDRWRNLITRDHHKLLSSDPLVALADALPAPSVIDPVEQVKLYRALRERQMCRFLPAGERPKVINSYFGVWKIFGKTMRLIADLRRGNMRLVPMSEVQKWHAKWREDNPELGLTPQAHGLLSPSELSNMPSGAKSKTKSDLRDFYHYLLVPVWMQMLQGLPPVSAVAMGLDPAVWGAVVYPVLTTLAMGGQFAPGLAQAAHEFVARPVLYRPLFLREVEANQCRSFVPLKEAPARWVSAVLRLLGDRGMPASYGSVTELGLPPAIMNLPVPSSLFKLWPDSAVTPQGELIRAVQWDLRAPDLESAISLYPRMEEGSLVHLLWLLYIDDHHSNVVPTEGVGLLRAEGVNNFSLLLMVIAYAFAGFKPHQDKLSWSSSVPSPSLGVTVDLRGPRALFYVDSQKLSELADFTLLVVAAARRVLAAGSRWAVPARFLEHLLGNWVWACLPRRSVLSVFQCVFSVVKGKSPSALVRVTSEVAWELETMANLAPMLFAEAKPLSDTVGASDACGTGRGSAVRGHCPGPVLRELASTVERHGSWTAFSPATDGSSVCRDSDAGRTAAAWLECDWTTRPSPWTQIRTGAWRIALPRCINLGECLSAVELVSWFASQPQRFGGWRVVVLNDNQATLGMMAKGRSSVRDMNALGARRVCAMALAVDLKLVWVYVRSELMPADFPSRRHLQTRTASEWIAMLSGVS
jgi:hypothetical protein